MTENSPIQVIAVALRAGDAARAEELSRQALARAPDDADIVFSLAMSLHMQRKLDDAVHAYRHLTELVPGSAVHWSNYASALMEADRPREAEAAFRRAIEHDPHDAVARAQLGILLMSRREYPAARDMLLDAFERDRNLPFVRVYAARACSLCQDFHGAEDLLRGWRQWLPLNDDTLQFELARLLLPMADAPGARLLLADILARRSDMHEAAILLVKVNERLNRLDESQALLQDLDRADLSDTLRGELAHARALLALRAGDAVGARDLLERTGPLNDDDYAFPLTLAQCFDKLGDAAAAMRMLAQAHAGQTAPLKIATPANYTAQADPLPATVLYTSAEQYRRWPRFRAPEAHDSPVFVVGFPRSGTTMLEQMLDAHPRLQSMDENPFFDRLANKLRTHDPRILDDLSVLRQYDCDELRKHYRIMAGEKVALREGTQLVDKNPLNMLWLPLIHRLFPKAKYILCIRHPCDVMLSCYMQNFRSGLLAAACENLPRLAAAYVQAMRSWLDHVEVFRPDVLVSRYEDLVADVEPQTRRIADFLGLEDATPMLRFDARAREKGYIATPSYTQVIRPVNTKAIGRWQRYREWFEPVLPTLQPMLEHWGYSANFSSSGTNGA
ncbi:MAG TPA: sulfotransferase [Rudaea sp.]|jgi:Flp pilus assembly protein TadD